MQRTVQVATPSDRTDQLIRQLEHLDDVIGLSVQRGGSIKPVGDVLIINALNKGIDEVLRAGWPIRAGEQTIPSLQPNRPA